MSFATAFLGIQETDKDETYVSKTIENLLNSVSPEFDVPDALVNVLSSNLCYGVPMRWMLGNGAQCKRSLRLLRDNLCNFEPRLSTVSGIKIVKDEATNSMTFVVAVTTKVGARSEEVEIITRLSQLDQHVNNKS